MNHNWVLGGVEAERVRLPVRRLRQQHHRAHRRSAADLPERRRDRLQHQHAADDRAAQVPVPRRLLLARDGHGRSRPRLQGRRQLHPRAAPVRDVHRPAAPTTPTRTSTNDLNGPISRVTRNKPGASANLPMDQYGLYIQDDWRVTDRLTINAGLRYDLVTGFLIDQSAIPNYIALTGAAAAGRFDGVPGFEEFGKKAQEDKNNWQPRIGGVYDLRGDGRDVVRGRLGHLLRLRLHQRQHPVPGPQRPGRIGRRVRREQHRRHQEPRRQLLHVRPADQQHRLAQRGQSRTGRSTARTWRRRRSGSRGRAQTSAGWSHEFSRTTVLDVDYVARRGQGPRRALAAQHAHSNSRRQRSAPICRSGAEPGQPDDEHEHRRVHLQRHQLRHPPAHGPRHSAECVVHAGEGQGPRRPGGRRAHDQPRAGFAQPAGRRAARAGRAARTHGTRSR